ncbi:MULTISPECIES: hypothetical protein [Streptomyces]|uniref:Lipoprotein n=1 Tax=Streptomyces thermoviolaceus subsp. thermoviolaceus TaxID=66860 RepID=A0ABX0YSE7_STRTL|nr:MULTISPECIES: hypothetical protein [Streptomyces]MCM3264818.1 hypothetical protein [Streptomyces thermoviolaceus]NJP15388.1 hypothetical protein [Streptomyces thermoviolaceus subsp. thermoviolaceus]RSS07006.1 hypothetical protein EF917_07140 [Streptomyces sp. WAC00469]WTD48625.1 hypothetical protein OG899_14540 [Streptomyces thermoviolaceus]GGV70016.1 lipoprotein [Streptomyces thermoviolaceus subsp. apingens]
MAQGQRRRAAAVLAAVLAVCAGTGGCAGDGIAAQDARAFVTPVQLLRQAPDALRAAGSSQAHTSLETAVGGTRVTIRGKGVYDFRRQLGRLTLVLPPGPTGVPVHRPITELLAPGALYMKNRGAGVPADKWVRVDTDTLSDGNLVTGGATDPCAAAEVLRGTRTASYVGETRVAGVAVRHYRGTADLHLAARNAPSSGAASLRAAADGFATADVPFDVYLDDQGRIRKLRQRFSFPGGRRDDAVAVYATTLLFGFGTPVSVTLPDEKDIYTGRIAEG